MILIAGADRGIPGGFETASFLGLLNHRGAGRALLDALVGRLLGGQRQHALHEDARGVDRVGVELARLDQLLDLGDGDPAGHRGQRVEVAGRGVEDTVTGSIGDGRADQCDVGDDGLLEHHLAAVDVVGDDVGIRNDGGPRHSADHAQHVSALPLVGADRETRLGHILVRCDEEEIRQTLESVGGVP